MRRWLVAGAVAALASAAATWSHVRLHNPSNKKPLYWSSPSNIGIVIHADGSDDMAGPEETAALRGALQSWNEVEGSTARLVENEDPEQQARSDWTADDLHLLYFDESNTSGFFPPGSGIVAITPVWFSSNGKISDADVLFNGSGYHFTTQGEPGAFDVGDVATHELGHLLGLDHSGSAGSSMYPYVDPTVLLHRSLASDDAVGLRAAYPESGATGSIRGRVERASNGADVAGALIVALDSDGRQVASLLSQPDGTFTLPGLLPGSYRLYARPMHGPVSVNNLTSGWQVETSFAASALSAAVDVTAGAVAEAGTFEVPATQPLVLGSSADPYPLPVESGSASALLVHGSGLGADCTLTCSDPEIEVSVIGWWNTAVQLWADVPSGHPSGNVDLVVTTPGGAVARLVGALEIVPPLPVVSAVSPTAIDSAGGTELWIEGDGFQAGMRAAIGDRVYVDGGALEVLDAHTLHVTTAATVEGLHDVVVLDPSGVEGRLVAAVETALLPSIESVFPSAGSAAGGTEILLRGEHYGDGLIVRIDGVEQAMVEVLDEQSARVVTGAGSPGGPYTLEVEIQTGAVASAAYSYAVDPDPQLDLVSPALGTAGESVTLHGANFTPDMSVVFGADPLTGLGGTPASSVLYVDSQTLSVLTPAHAGGPTSVMVCDTEGQAYLLPSGFEYESSGGGGGGCAALAGAYHRGPGNHRDALAGTWWIAAAFALALGQRARARARRIERVHA
jgi:hypothetical protein